MKLYYGVEKKKLALAIPLISVLLVGCKDETLLKGLDQNQANEIIALLQRNNITSSKQHVSKEGYVVSVSPQDFAPAVDLMNIYDLPTRPRVEIAQMFPSDSLVSSPRAEKARLYSGIEQRLEQSITLLDKVVSARVHMSYDLNSIEGQRKSSPVHLSAVIRHDGTMPEPTLLISDVKRFLKNSFEEVDYDNISVVLSQIPEVQRLTPQSEQSSGYSSTLVGLVLGTMTLVIASFYLIIMNWRKGGVHRKIIPEFFFHSNSRSNFTRKQVDSESPESKKDDNPI
ncbi:EscJ/YscJ/HrcJ family type III secretion inner membrane ring protein [Enterobacter huaxiensis]|uniref:EscJ/YscJ/HrcJ family type III secretion inner membrane ring protein n=1 Tax=Enterobacter huaxiensis TaxID=2494702 RepID=UPI0021D844BA|nr:EscJ/YscJ/HrcJ family type III secretion inner membrane ring protein [Enterobacter huaxiensis]